MKTYSSNSNAKRAALALQAKLPEGSVVSLNGKTFTVYVNQPEVTVHPDLRAALAEFSVTYPAPPSPAESPIARRNIKPRSLWDESTCVRPVQVAWVVFHRYLRAGIIDNRKDAIAEAMAAGVQRNTAHTQYRRFREAHGMFGAVSAK